MSKAVYATLFWGIYSVTRFGLRRFNIYPGVLRKTRFISIPIYFGYIYYVSRQYTDAHGDDGIREYRVKRSMFEHHSNIMKKILRSKIELLQAQPEYEEKSVNIRKLIDNQGK